MAAISCRYSGSFQAIHRSRSDSERTRRFRESSRTAWRLEQWTGHHPTVSPRLSLVPVRRSGDTKRTEPTSQQDKGKTHQTPPIKRPPVALKHRFHFNRKIEASSYVCHPYSNNPSPKTPSITHNAGNPDMRTCSCTAVIRRRILSATAHHHITSHC